MIQLDYRDRRPIYEQIVDQIQFLIMQGVYKPDMQLPSVRKMAMDLSINPNTIQKAYNQLESLGLTYSLKGRGCYITPNVEVIDLRMEQFYLEFQDMVVRAREQGISEMELIKRLKKYYKEGMGNAS